MWRRTVMVVALICLWPLMAMADDDVSPNCPYGMTGGGMGPGMMGGGWGMGPGMTGGSGWGGMGMMGGGRIAMLDLTDEQRSKVNKILDDERSQHWNIMGQMMQLQNQQRDLYSADKRDVQAILKNEEQTDQLRRKMLEVHLKAEDRMQALLTKEQLEQLRQWRRHPWGPGGYGPGMMGPGGYGPRGMMRP